MKRKLFDTKKGTILIVALWTLSLLAAFAAILGMGIRQRISVFSRLEERHKLNWLAEAGIKKAVAVLNRDLTLHQNAYSITGKITRHNNPEDFSGIRLNGGVCEVVYVSPYNRKDLRKHYGVVGEESKININKADFAALTKVIQFALDTKKEDADRLARSIIDWRTSGEGELTGFYSEKYYENLQYPYELKNADFEVLEELLLVKGFHKDILRKLSPYMTVYGSGTININTAPAYVLFSAGLTEELAKKIIVVRRGKDGLEASEDDFIFQNVDQVAEDLRQFFTLEKEEIQEINDLVSGAVIGVNSYFYRIVSRATLDGKRAEANIECVFNAPTRTFSFWKAEY